MDVIIVDDEPKAIELLKGYAGQFSTLNVLETFRNGLRALEYLKDTPVDLVFLDINMPHLSGIALSKILDPGIKVIFTTAYAEYAVESYEIEAVDYLLKPISFERFAMAIHKLSTPGQRVDEQEETKAVYIKSGSRTHRLYPKEILYLEKDGNYMIYHFATQKILARESTAEAIGHLPDHFCQAHKSFIVNLLQVKYVEKDQLMLADRMIPIGPMYREQLLKEFEKT